MSCDFTSLLLLIIATQEQQVTTILIGDTVVYFRIIEIQF